jgi:hypothetical protein
VAASQDRGVGAVTFWQFLDRQIGRIRPSGVAGAGIFLLTGAVLWMLYRDRTLADNDLFKTLAQAIVVQGLIGLAMAAWFTKKDDAPRRVQIDQPPDDPVPVKEE